MGAMKNIAIDTMDLQEAAYRAESEEDFLEHVRTAGWMSPTEIQGRYYQAARIVAELPENDRANVQSVLETLGIKLPAVDFPFRDISSPTAAFVQNQTTSHQGRGSHLVYSKLEGHEGHRILG